MNISVRHAAVVAAAAAGSVLAAAPAAAFAAGPVPAVAPAASDTRTTLNTAQLTAKITAVQKATDIAAARGYTGTATLTPVKGVKAESAAIQQDNVHGVVAVRVTLVGLAGTWYQVADRGVYMPLSGLEKTAVKAYTGRTVSYEFMASQDPIGDAGPQLPSGDALTGATGTLVTHDDATSDLTAKLKTESFVAHLNADGALVSVDEAVRNVGNAHAEFSYGAQKIPVPPVSTVVAAAVVEHAVFYQNPRKVLRDIAQTGVYLDQLETQSAASLRRNVRDALNSREPYIRKAVKVTDIHDGLALKAYDKPAKKWVTVKVTYAHGKYSVK